MISFEGKVALVVGSTSGIGEATVRAFARRGAKVVVSGRRERLGQDVVRAIEDVGGTGLFVHVDVRDAASIEAMIDQVMEHFGQLDCAFNAAGIERYGALAELSVEDLDNVLATNLRGLSLCMKYEIPAMLAGGGGAIVNASSQGGNAVGVPTNSPYTAAKAGVVGITRTIALEGSPHIRVNAVAAANIRADMARGAWKSFNVSEDELVKHSPVGRLGEPESPSTPEPTSRTDSEPTRGAGGQRAPPPRHPRSHPPRPRRHALSRTGFHGDWVCRF